ncbi:MAG: hypothetical protein ACOYT9_03575 [Patescibacteria group bacterium]
MKRKITTGHWIGIISFILYLFFSFVFGAGYLSIQFLKPVLYFFPELNDPNVAMAGLVFWMGAIVLEFICFPVMAIILAKLFRVAIRVIDAIYGYIIPYIVLLFAAQIVNWLYLVFP